MYNMHVLCDTQGRQKQKYIVARKLLMWCKIRFSSLYFNVISSSHTAYFSKCVVIEDSIASVTDAITVVSLE